MKLDDLVTILFLIMELQFIAVFVFIYLISQKLNEQSEKINQYRRRQKIDDVFLTKEGKWKSSQECIQKIDFMTDDELSEYLHADNMPKRIIGGGIL